MQLQRFPPSLSLNKKKNTKDRKKAELWPFISFFFFPSTTFSCPRYLIEVNAAVIAATRHNHLIYYEKNITKQVKGGVCKRPIVFSNLFQQPLLSQILNGNQRNVFSEPFLSQQGQERGGARPSSCCSLQPLFPAYCSSGPERGGGRRGYLLCWY